MERERVQPMSGYRVGYVIGSLSTQSVNRTRLKRSFGWHPKI
jgi:hypothetical protein